jgi:hypothetical protein
MFSVTATGKRWAWRPYWRVFRCIGLGTGVYSDEYSRIGGCAGSCARVRVRVRVREITGLY